MTELTASSSRPKKIYLALIGTLLFGIISAGVFVLYLACFNVTNLRLAADFTFATTTEKDWVYVQDGLRKVLNSSDSLPEDKVAGIHAFRRATGEFDTDKVVKKWKSEVRIAESGNKLVDEEMKWIVESLPNIESLKVKIVPFQSKHANVRVITYDRADLTKDDVCPRYSPFCRLVRNPRSKRGYVRRMYGAIDGIETNKESQNFYRKATLFTPRKINHVEGFILSDENHNIQRAECSIFEHGRRNLLRRYVTECLLRALGFTDAFVFEANSALSSPSVAFSVGPLPELAGPAVQLLSVLYDDRVKSGTSRIGAFFSALDVLCRSRE